jgi:hypothetical protein
VKLIKNDPEAKVRKVSEQLEASVT